jgi:hypothetical protein
VTDREAFQAILERRRAEFALRIFRAIAFLLPPSAEADAMKWRFPKEIATSQKDKCGYV